MALRTVNTALLLLFLCFYPGVWSGSQNFYTSGELISILATTPLDLFPEFLASLMDILDILLKGALVIIKRRRGNQRVPPQTCALTAQQSRRTSTTFAKEQTRFLLHCPVLQGDMAVWINTRSRAWAGWVPTVQRGQQHRTLASVKVGVSDFM